MHGVIVMGSHPFLIFVLVTILAFDAAHENNGKNSVRGISLRNSRSAFEKVERRAEKDYDGGNDACDFPAYHVGVFPFG